MSRLEELIQELCPNGVEYKKLGEIATISRGGNLQKKDFCAEGVPCIHYGQIYTRYGLFADKALTFISENCAKKQKMAYTNDVIMAVTSENIEDVCKCVAWLGKDAIAVSGHTAIIRHNQSAKYLTYYFHTEMFAVQKRKLVHGTKVMEVTPDALNSVVIPIPPLPVQSEIVRILDSFTMHIAELEENLTAELTSRKKQYEYYRDVILRSKAAMATKKLGEICDFVRGPFGGSLKKEIFTQQGYAVYEQQHAIYGEFRFRYYIDEKKFNEMKRFQVHSGDLIMSCSGTMGRVSIIPENAPKGVINQALLKLTPKSGVSSKYLKYCFENSVAKQMNSTARGGAIQNVASVNVLKDIEIHVPSLPEQQHIVAVLDRFDTLCNKLTNGLPAEIEARQKQYEYYRDKLLTFKEAV